MADRMRVTSVMAAPRRVNLPASCSRHDPLGGVAEWLPSARDLPGETAHLVRDRGIADEFTIRLPANPRVPEHPDRRRAVGRLARRRRRAGTPVAIRANASDPRLAPPPTTRVLPTPPGVSLGSPAPLPRRTATPVRRRHDAGLRRVGGGNLLRSWRALTGDGRLVAYGLQSCFTGGRRGLGRVLSSAAGWAE